VNARGDLKVKVATGAAVVTVTVAALLWWRRRKGKRVDVPPSVSPMNAALLGAGRDLVPDASTVLRPGDARLDPVYGGRVADVAGAPAWRYYDVKLADGSSGGTTCGVALAYLLGRAGWPADMVNRAPDDAWAPGGGFVPGLHVSKIVGGARSRGFYLGPQAGPQVGDAYHVDHPGRPNSDHVGLVKYVGAPLPNGTRAVVTIDGGQETGATVREEERVLSADGRTLTLGGVPARVLGWIRAPQGATSGEAVA
jgi:hypothetical protein